MTMIPEHMLHIPAMVDDATSQPSGRFSMRRPRIALRMMMNGPANTHTNTSKRNAKTFSPEKENFGGLLVSS